MPSFELGFPDHAAVATRFGLCADASGLPNSGEKAPSDSRIAGCGFPAVRASRGGSGFLEGEDEIPGVVSSARTLK